MPLTPPGVARRWTVIGHTPDHWECTMILDLLTEGSDYVTIHPAGVTTYTVTVERTGIQLLLDTIESENACAVPVRHPVHGERLLCVRPFEPTWTNRPADTPLTRGPMMLDLTLPDSQILIVFRDARLHRLTAALTQILTVTSVAPQDIPATLKSTARPPRNNPQE